MDETRIDNLDFFGSLAQSYGNRHVLGVIQALSDVRIVQLVTSAACKNRKDCSRGRVTHSQRVCSLWPNVQVIVLRIGSLFDRDMLVADFRSPT
jgi:hypothetical protein